MQKLAYLTRAYLNDKIEIEGLALLFQLVYLLCSWDTMKNSKGILGSFDSLKCNKDLGYRLVSNVSTVNFN